MAASTKKTIAVAIAAIALIVLLMFLVGRMSNSKAKVASSEAFYAAGELGIPGGFKEPDSVALKAPTSPDAAASGFEGIAASDPTGNEMYNPVSGGAAGSAAAACFPRDRLSADDLLPKDAANSKWAQMNPSGQGDVRDQNFLTAGYHIGIITNNSRNANLQLRSEPPNPTIPVSVFNNPTIQPDSLRKPLEIGSY